jgi:hypothetical protein
MSSAGVVVAEVYGQRSLNRKDRIVLSPALLRRVGARADIARREERRPVGRILECALIHQHAPAVDGQGEDGEQGDAAQAEDDEDLPTLAAESS